MPLILGANSLAGGYQVKNSARFNSGSSDNLTRTPASSGNRQIFTYSTWLKKSLNTSRQFLLSAISATTDRDALMLYSDDTIRFWFDNDKGGDVYSSALYRDISAWYHIILAIDTTQATNTNRIKIYVNGSQITLSGTYPVQNYQALGINVNKTQYIGTAPAGSDYFSGYLTETYFIDGQQLTPSSFGETDEDTGIWKPKAYTGTFGTNGFYLDFEDSANLGNDMSGNNNDFTVNNLTSIDQTTDTPTNNFATWNPLYAYGNQTLTEGNLRLATGTSGASVGTIAVNTGKWYWEQKCISINVESRIMGISKLVANESLYDTAVYYKSDGQKIINNTNSSYGATLANNDIVGLAIDVDAKSITFYKNGSSQGSIDISSVYSSGDYIIPALPQSGGASQTVEINFGNPPYSSNGYTDGAGFGNFSYSVPSGYYALCTKNLANFG